MSNKVSIILLSYNQADYIEEALKSVFEQTQEKEILQNLTSFSIERNF